MNEEFFSEKYICINNSGLILKQNGHNFKNLIINEIYTTHSPWSGYFNGESKSENIHLPHSDIGIDERSIYILNGDKIMGYYKYRFITLAEFREQRINKILDEKISEVDAPSLFSRHHK